MGEQTKRENGLTFNEYQRKAARTANTDLGKVEELKNYAMGLVGEAAEVSEHIKKFAYHGHGLSHEEITNELGDVLFYAANLARVLDITLEDAAGHNNRKLAARYPDGFSEEASRSRKV